MALMPLSLSTFIFNNPSHDAIRLTLPSEGALSAIPSPEAAVASRCEIQCGDVLLAKIPKPVHIFMPNDMATFKSRAFESARHDFRYVVA
jgi:hypothetical protein